MNQTTCGDDAMYHSSLLVIIEFVNSMYRDGYGDKVKKWAQNLDL